jgi:hypothetical protein
VTNRPPSNPTERTADAARRSHRAAGDTYTRILNACSEHTDYPAALGMTREQYAARIADLVAACKARAPKPRGPAEQWWDRNRAELVEAVSR